MRPNMLSAVLWAATLPVACKANSTTATKVYQGVKDETSLPGTIRLEMYSDGSARYLRACTGTVLSDTLVITAARCLVDEVKVIVGVFKAAPSVTESDPGANALSWHRHPQWTSTLEHGRGTDVAFVVFAAGSVPGALRANLSTTPAKEGDRLTFIGYGAKYFYKLGNKTMQTGYEVRRIGRNTVQSIGTDADRLITATANSEGASQFYLAGDEGGAVYNEAGDVVGIMNTGIVTEDGVQGTDIDLNVHSSVTGGFIKEHIPGFDPQLLR